MRQCANCYTKTDDSITICPNCDADLNTDSVRAKALVAIKASIRSSAVYIATERDACPACRAAQGTFPKDSDDIPVLPIEGCSCLGGCSCRYEPLVVEVGP